MKKYIWKFSSNHPDNDKIEIVDCDTNEKFCTILVHNFTELLSNSKYEMFRTNTLHNIVFLNQQKLEDTALKIYSTI